MVLLSILPTTAELKKLIFNCLFTLAILLTFSCKFKESSEKFEGFSGVKSLDDSEIMRFPNYYKNDSLKHQAALFIVKNIDGHYSLDTTLIQQYRPLLHLYDSLNRHKDTHPDFPVGRIINPLWQKYQDSIAIVNNQETLVIKEDRHSISSDYLIKDLNMAFSLWRKSSYADSISFNNFCEYILPYRKAQGLAIEDWRAKISGRHAGLLKKLKNQSLQFIVDNVLSYYKDYKHTSTVMPSYPYLKFEDFEISKRATCETRCWYNSMVFSALSIPVTVDFVPAWGNRNSNHSWNCLVVKNKIYPFEPFWDKDRWKYKRIYNNEVSDSLWGPFRLPKVFRYSYTTNLEVAELNKSVNVENIPALFKNTKFKDVSDQYFKTVNIGINIIGNQLNARYAYLCVFNNNQWVPVQYGKINNGRAMFKKMGRDIIYLPAFYQSGKVIPAAKAFFIDKKGKNHEFNPGYNQKKQLTAKRYWPELEYTGRGIEYANATIQLSNDIDFKNVLTSMSFKALLNYMPVERRLPNGIKFRYVRFYFERKMIGNLSEIKLVSVKGKDTLQIKGVPTYSKNLERVDAIKPFDNNQNTFIPPNFVMHEKSGNCWIGLDLKNQLNVTSILFYPRNDGRNLISGRNYELYYWDNKQWSFLATNEAVSNKVVWDNVPINTFYLIKPLPETNESRIFMYEGNQIWK